MDIVTYALAKKFAIKVASGFSSVSVNQETSTIDFVLNDGKKVSLQIPRLNEVKSVDIDKNTGHVIFIMSNGESIDAGELPKQKIEISKKEGNALVKEKDGYYVSKTGVTISQEENNALENKDDGLYVASIDGQRDKVIGIVTSLLATEEDINNIFDFMNNDETII